MRNPPRTSARCLNPLPRADARRLFFYLFFSVLVPSIGAGQEHPTTVLPKPTGNDTSTSKSAAELVLIIQRQDPQEQDFTRVTGNLLDGLKSAAKNLQGYRVSCRLWFYDSDSPNPEPWETEPVDINDPALLEQITKQIAGKTGKLATPYMNTTVRLAVAMLSPRPGELERKRVILLIGDGYNRIMDSGPEQEKIGKEARRAGITIDIVHLDREEDSQTFTAMAKASNGTTYIVHKKTIDDLRTQLDKFGADLRNKLAAQPGPPSAVHATPVDESPTLRSEPTNPAQPKTQLLRFALVTLVGAGAILALLRRSLPRPLPLPSGAAALLTPPCEDSDRSLAELSTRPPGVLLSLTGSSGTMEAYPITEQGLELGDTPQCACYISGRGKGLFACRVAWHDGVYLLSIPPGIEVEVHGRRVEQAARLSDNMRIRIEGVELEFKQTALSQLIAGGPSGAYHV